MQTFGITLQLSLSTVVPAQFLAEARKEAQAEGAPLFLKTMQDKFPEDDDQFMLAIVKNAFRTNTRLGALGFMQRSGIGGKVSPVQIVAESITQPKDAVAAFAAATDPDIKLIAPTDEQIRAVGGVPVKAEQLRITQDTPGTLVQGLVEGRAE